jgi:prepilin-type N-terminal cleavage/methylation domain-containing protein
MISKKLINYRKSRAFTLVELLVVIAIIALLLSVLMPSLSKARFSAKRTICAARQKAFVLAATVYQSGNNGKYPRSLSMNEIATPPTGLWPNNATRDWDGDGKARSYGEKITDYLGDSIAYDMLICPLVNLSKERYELSKRYYSTGDSAWLYCSYAFYWNYALRPTTGKTFIGPGIQASRNSKLLTSDLCVYSTAHLNRWFVAHPPEKLPRYTNFLYGFAWEVPWPNCNSVFPIKINGGLSDGSVSLIDSKEIIPVSFEGAYRTALSIGVPGWAAQ